MLLVEMKINGVWHLLSNDYHDLPEGFYDGYIASLGQLRIATRKPYGGIVEASYGQLDLLPTPFTLPGNWPPPRSCAIKISIGTPGTSSVVSYPGSALVDEGGDSPTDGTAILVDDGAALGIIQNPSTIELIVEGTAHLRAPSRDSVKYDIYGPQIETRVTDAKYTGTLQEVFAAACITLGLAFDYTYARAVSPVVDYTADGERLLTDNLSVMAEFFSHRAPIENGTLYLIDCLLDNGPVLELTEFDIFPSSYPAPAPIKRITAKVQAEIWQYRWVLTANQGATVCAIAEIELRTKVDGSDVSGTATFTASSTSGANVPANLNDNDNNTLWVSTIAPSENLYVQASYGGKIKIIGYTFRAPTLNFARMPTEWKVQGYDLETSTWRTIKEEITEDDWTAGEVRKFSIAQPEWEVVVAGSHSYGETLDISPACQTTRALIRPALTNIKTIMERMQIQLTKPLSGVPKFGQKIELLDESMPVPSNVWGRVAEQVYDWDGEQCIVIGEGAITAA